MVETPTRRIGRVAGIRYGERTNEPAVHEVRAGMFGRKTLLLSIDDITQVNSEKRRIVLREQFAVR